MLSNEWDNKFAFAKGTWYFQTLPKKHVVHSGFDTNLDFGHITKGLLGCGINCGKSLGQRAATVFSRHQAC